MEELEVSRQVSVRLSLVLMAGLATGAAFGPSLAGAATFTWNGLGGNVNWSTATNWGGSAPTSNAATGLIFAGSTNPGTLATPLSQNIATPMILDSITF